MRPKKAVNTNVIIAGCNTIQLNPRVEFLNRDFMSLAHRYRTNVQLLYKSTTGLDLSCFDITLASSAGCFFNLFPSIYRVINSLSYPQLPD